MKTSTFTRLYTAPMVCSLGLLALLFIAPSVPAYGQSNNSATWTYPISPTGQNDYYDNADKIAAPAAGQPFYGQDAQFATRSLSFTDNGDGTITDNLTGLLWAQGQSAAMGWESAQSYCRSLTLGGYSDWRLPTLKELWSIRDFSAGWPYVDTKYFHLPGNGFEASQQHTWSSNYYLVNTSEAMKNVAFIVNNFTGHIKALDGRRYVRAVRGNTYGINNFAANGDGTISDKATGLMWAQDDSGEGMNWESALAWAQTMNASSYLGHNDWRLPNVKELQSIVDYSGVFPAIDPMFKITKITNEAGNADYPYFWTSTSNPYIDPKDTHGYWYAWYVAFGYAVGHDGKDVHGAGAVRFDTKVQGGPSGVDGERYYNYVRLVRNAASTPTLSLMSAASYDGAAVAPASIVSAFGSDLSGGTVTVKDSGGSVRTAEVYVAADKQVNFVLPEATAMGTATVSVMKEGQVAASGAVTVTKVAPAVFSANASGKGAAAALAVKVGAGGEQTTTATFQCGQTIGSCSASPIDLGAATEQVLLSLFCTGMRGAAGQATATVGGTAVSVAGPVGQSQYAGLDQVNLGPLPRTLAGRGEVEILLTVDGKKTNAVTVNIK